MIDGDRWTEIGEKKTGPGSEWTRIFGMELRRVARAADVPGCITVVAPKAQVEAK